MSRFEPVEHHLTTRIDATPLECTSPPNGLIYKETMRLNHLTVQYRQEALRVLPSTPMHQHYPRDSSRDLWLFESLIFHILGQHSFKYQLSSPKHLQTPFFLKTQTRAPNKPRFSTQVSSRCVLSFRKSTSRYSMSFLSFSASRRETFNGDHVFFVFFKVRLQGGSCWYGNLMQTCCFFGWESRIKVIKTFSGVSGIYEGPQGIEKKTFQKG